MEELFRLTLQLPLTHFSKSTTFGQELSRASLRSRLSNSGSVELRVSVILPEQWHLTFTTTTTALGCSRCVTLQMTSSIATPAVLLMSTTSKSKTQSVCLTTSRTTEEPFQARRSRSMWVSLITYSTFGPWFLMHPMITLLSGLLPPPRQESRISTRFKSRFVELRTSSI